MAYHLGRILQYDFGVEAVAVTVDDEKENKQLHTYDLRMPIVSREKMERQITDADILIANPGFSRFQFGWRIPGFKISYVQGFTNYKLLDLRFNHYVAVSDFVQQFLYTVYGLQTEVIPPFLNLDQLPVCSGWTDRPEDVVLPYRKGIPEIWDLSFQRLRQLLIERAPRIRVVEPIPARIIAHAEFLSVIGSARYLLMLSAGEGFGLVPLEAMAMGTIVAGYDGFGGRHYMRSGDNCMVASYGQIERVADLLIEIWNDPLRGEAMAKGATEVAANFTYKLFRESWIREFSRVLPLSATGTH